MPNLLPIAVIHGFKYSLPVRKLGACCEDMQKF